MMMYNTSKAGVRMIVLAAGLLAAAPALAQSGRFDKPIGGSRGSGTSSAQSGSKSDVNIVMSQSDGGDEFEVTIHNNDVSAKVNGKEIPKDQIRRTGDKIEILDKDGNVATTFTTTVVHIDSAPEGTQIYRMLGGQNGSFGGGAVAMAGPAPKAMLGLTMGDISESLQEHLSLEAGSAVSVERVIDGLPADKAGVKKGDVIVSFDGQKPISAAKIHELLQSKDAGDKVKIVVLRKGEEKTLTVELQKYDPKRLDIARTWSATGGMGAMGQANQQQQEAERALHEALLSQHEAMKNLNANGFMFGPGGNRMELFSPAATPELKEKMAALDKKLEALDEKMSKLDEQLDRLQKKLDQLGERRGRD
jgi:PDZ domain